MIHEMRVRIQARAYKYIYYYYFGMFKLILWQVLSTRKNFRLIIRMQHCMCMCIFIQFLFIIKIFICRRNKILIPKFLLWLIKTNNYFSCLDLCNNRLFYFYEYETLTPSTWQRLFQIYYIKYIKKIDFFIK